MYQVLHDHFTHHFIERHCPTPQHLGVHTDIHCCFAAVATHKSLNMVQHVLLQYYTSTQPLHCARRCRTSRSVHPALARHIHHLPTPLCSSRRVLVRADSDNAPSITSQEQGSKDDPTDPTLAPTPPTEPPSLHAAAALLATQLRAVFDAAVGFAKLVFSYITQVWWRVVGCCGTTMGGLRTH